MCGFAIVLVYRLKNEECVALHWCWFMVYRTRNITFGVHLSWFLRLCWFVVYRTRNSWSAHFLVFALVLVYGL